MKFDRWLFATTGGKIAVGSLALIGTVAIIAAAVRYDHAREMVKKAQWKAEIAADEWRGHSLSRNVVFKDYRKVRGKGYVENLFDGERTVENVEWVKPTFPIINEPDSMAVFSRYVKGRGSRKGYLDIYSGRVRISDMFKHAWNFKNGAYAVVCQDNDSLYVIDRRGRIVSKRGFKLSNQIGFGFMFNDDLCIMEDNNGKFGIINPYGDWVLEPEYDKILRIPINGDYKVTSGNLHGIKDKDMKDILPLKYDYLNFREVRDDPNNDEIWMKDVAYWARIGEGKLEYFDKDGNIVK